MHRGRPATAGSKILENFVSPLDATVVARLEAAGITIIGKTKLDEFSAGGLFPETQCQNTTPTLSSQPAKYCGAVSAVADGIAEFALCNDYTGAVSIEAAAHGICYIQPTYGTVSRYGLIQAVPSMDQIGIACKTPADGFRVLSLIAGNDTKDGAMFPDTGHEKSEKIVSGGTDSELRVGVPVNVLDQIPDASAVTEFANNYKTVEFELEYFDVFAQVMQILCCAELANSISRYDGIKFGYRAGEYENLHELYTKSRTEALGIDAKFAAIVGSMVLSQDNYMRYYDKAMRIRRLIKESLAFDKYDVIVMPAGAVSGIGSGQEKSGNSAARQNAVLALHALPRLCGFPSVTAPLSGGGVTLIANARREDLLSMAAQRV